MEVLLNAEGDPGAVDQAAADDSVETLSSRNSTFVSTPAAVDVVGPGYPLDCKEDTRSPSVMSVARPLHLDSARRTNSALGGAKQQRSNISGFRTTDGRNIALVRFFMRIAPVPIRAAVVLTLAMYKKKRQTTKPM